MKASNSKWVNGIDSLRFFLALIVFLSHIPNTFAHLLKANTLPAFRTMGMIITPLFSGTSAVIAFFIISGFVIHYPNKNKPFNTKNFLIRRWLRIGLPLLVIGAFATHFKIYGLIPVWSLYCELIYYTLYPLLIKIKVPWKTKFLIAFVLSFVVILVFAQNDVLALIHHTSKGLVGQYWQLGTLLTWIVGLPCWLLGVILAEEFDSMNKDISSIKLWSLRLLIFLLSVSVQVLRFKMNTSVLLTGNLLALALFLWLRVEFSYYKKHEPVRFFENLGKFSYSLYLCHEIFVFFIVKYITVTPLTYPVIIIVTVAGSYVVYLMVEYPSHKLAQWLTKKRSAIATQPK